MLDKFKTIIIILLSLYYIYKFIGYDYENIPISIVENNLITNSSSYAAIYVDEIKNVAYLKLNSTYDDVIYKTSFSVHDNFREFVKNITGEHYKNINVSYHITNTFTDLVKNIIISIIGINIIFSVLNMLIPKSSKKTIGGEEDHGLFSVFSPIETSSFYTLIKNSDIKFDDVVGLEVVKEDLREFVKYIQFNEIYKLNGCTIPRGLLFVGPPGVGKTFIAKAFASESKATFIYTTGSSFNEIYMGMGSKRIKQLFEYARLNTPCIIFIDEIDAIGSRTVSRDSGEINRTINALLAEMDGMVDSTGIMVIAATNLDEVLDPALTRSGRFDKKIVFDLPTYQERRQLFETYLSKIELNSSFDHEKDIKLLAQRTARLSGADIKNICNQGILNHMKQYVVITNVQNNNKMTLENTNAEYGCTLKDLNDALDDIGIGNKKSERAMTDKEKLQVAYHEAGHTLISCLVENGNVPLKVSIIPRGHSLGFTQPDPVDQYLVFRKELLANICITLGGRAAEQIIFDDVTSGASDDLKKVSDMANKYYKDHSFGDIIHITSDKLHSEKYKSDLNNYVQDLINTCFNEVVRMLSCEKNKIILTNIANTLLEKETLNNSDLLEIIPKENIGLWKLTM